MTSTADRLLGLTRTLPCSIQVLASAVTSELIEVLTVVTSSAEVGATLLGTAAEFAAIPAEQLAVFETVVECEPGHRAALDSLVWGLERLHEWTSGQIVVVGIDRKLRPEAQARLEQITMVRLLWNRHVTLSAEWQNLLAQPATPVRSLAREDVPDAPGVYLWWRNGVEQYVGTAKSLRGRLWRKHLGNGLSASGSSFRRNVACLLFQIPPSVTGTGRQKLTRNRRTPFASGFSAASSRGSRPPQNRTPWRSRSSCGPSGCYL